MTNYAMAINEEGMVERTAGRRKFEVIAMSDEFAHLVKDEINKIIDADTARLNWIESVQALWNGQCLTYLVGAEYRSIMAASMREAIDVARKDKP